MTNRHTTRSYNKMEDAEPPPLPPLANNQHIKLPCFSPINIISWFAMAEEEQAAHVAAVPGQSGQGGQANREPCAWSEN